jgi:flagellar biosynthesis GTPase FlhF
MKTSTLTRLGLTVAMSAALAAMSFTSHAQHGADVSAPHKAEAQQDKQEKIDEKKQAKAHQQEQRRLSKQQQQERIREQKQHLSEYNQRIAQQQAIALRNAQQLEQQKRLAHYRYQQAYYEQLRQQQARLENDRYDYDNDPFYYTPPTYRYRRGDNDYQTNEYGAEQLRRASNTGYQKGYEAGRADKQDNWRFDYRESFAYQDANYGFDGRYVRQEDYNHYFREGFQRGYEDGYYGRRTYGTNANGSDSLLGTVLNMILNLQPAQ